MRALQEIAAASSRGSAISTTRLASQPISHVAAMVPRCCFRPRWRAIAFHNRDLGIITQALGRVPAPRRNWDLRRGVLTLPTTKMLRATLAVVTRSQSRRRLGIGEEKPALSEPYARPAQAFCDRSKWRTVLPHRPKILHAVSGAIHDWRGSCRLPCATGYITNR